MATTNPVGLGLPEILRAGGLTGGVSQSAFNAVLPGWSALGASIGYAQTALSVTQMKSIQGTPIDLVAGVANQILQPIVGWCRYRRSAGGGTIVTAPSMQIWHTGAAAVYSSALSSSFFSSVPVNGRYTNTQFIASGSIDELVSGNPTLSSMIGAGLVIRGGNNLSGTLVDADLTLSVGLVYVALPAGVV